MAVKGMNNPQTLKKRRTLITNLVEVAKAWDHAEGIDGVDQAVANLQNAVRRLEEHEKEHGPTPWLEVS